jgi:hypothetical protein
MKKRYLAALAAGALALSASGSVFAYGDGMGIVGSPHDFTDGVKFKGTADEEIVDEISEWNWRGEICRVCHAPHDKQREAYKEGLLWNRALSTAEYELYESSTLDGAISQPVGRAKMCLSCHDNTVALQQFDSYSDPADGAPPNTGTFFDLYPDSHFIIGGTLADNSNTLAGTHPISVMYRADLDGGLHDPDQTLMGETGSNIRAFLDDGMVQCSSCHDVHNKTSVPNTRLLRVAQTAAQGGTASGLCLTCHDK